jgi:WD40 repeat protein
MILRKKVIENLSEINSLEFSPDSKSLAFSSRDKTVKIYNIESDEIIEILSEHNSPNVLVAYSPDGKYLFSGSGDDLLKIWGSKSFKILKTIKGLGAYSLLCSPDSKYIISSIDENSELIKIYDINTGKIVKIIEGEGSITSLSYSSDSKYISWAATRGLFIIDINLEKIIQTIDEFYYFSDVKYSPDKKHLACVVIGEIDHTNIDKYGGIDIYKVNNGKLTSLCHLENSLGVNKISYSPNGKFIASGNFNDGLVSVWDINSYSLKFVLEKHFNKVTSLAWSPNGKYLASGSENGEVKLWEVKL